MEILDVKISVTKEDTGKEIASNFFQTCSFCDKLVKVGRLNFKTCCRLSGSQFFCPFCLRHDFHHRSSRNILILSFRAIVGFYYYRRYQSDRDMYLNEIQAMVDQHARVGVQNPTFSYDPFTMLWFVNFNKIGNESRKAPYGEVEATALAALNVFNLSKAIRQSAHEEMWKKYQEAMKTFYEKRQRPKDRRMLIPTLTGIAHGEKPEFFEKTRDFVYSHLEIL